MSTNSIAPVTAIWIALFCSVVAVFSAWFLAGFPAVFFYITPLILGAVLLKEFASSAKNSKTFWLQWILRCAMALYLADLAFSLLTAKERLFKGFIEFAVSHLSYLSPLLPVLFPSLLAIAAIRAFLRETK
ncbi:hypothetical protein [Halocynthiibacter sp.]|uniref:hypothetical protein n=1 Tax=Halocynthiibacter sp. TaxID=1979210 RepID=UPI003C3E4B9B